uniref:TonB-dependent receptor domain-containing protein n=1 Tax=Thaumasiovibrio occultus TaxID=1891184 RepID=UPI000B35A1DC|nr:TonB-dependent receptor [Thaumasiovibrio occultus]
MKNSSKFSLSPLYLALISAAVTAPLHADVASEDNMVVTGASYDSGDIIIDSETLDKRQANDLSDVFRGDAEIEVGGGSSVSQKIYVRGLEDTMLNVTVDGAVQSGNMYHHQGRLSIEPELLKQVEVSAGAGRATDGAGALGGAIRFETKNPEDLLLEGERFGAQVKAGYFSNTDGHKESLAGYGYVTDNISVLGSVIYSDFDNYTDGFGDEQPHTEAENLNSLVKVVADLTDAQRVTVSYENLSDEGYRYHRPQWQPSFKNVAFNQEFGRETITGRYQYQPANNPLLNIDATVYHTETKLDHLEGPWGDIFGEAKSVGGDIRNTSQFGEHQLIYGVDYRRDKGFIGSPIYGDNEDTGRVVGAYVQGDFRLTDALLFSAGARYDDYYLSESNGPTLEHDGFSPNVAFQYQVTPELSAYVGYAEAVRGAQVREIYKLDSSNSNENRVEEEAQNTEIGFDWQSQNVSLSAVAYRTEIANVVDEIYSPREIVNVGDLKNTGVTVSAGYYWEGLSTRLSYNVSRPELNGEPLNDDTKAIGVATGDSWVADFSYSLNNNWELGYTGTYVKRLTRVAEGYSEKPGYALHDVYVQWIPLDSQDVVLSLAVKNLLDKAYRDHASYGETNVVANGTYDAGRDIRFNVTFGF